jgi:hypothetical protein
VIHISAGFWPEDKAHQINAKSLNLADVFGIAHATNLNDHLTI